MKLVNNNKFEIEFFHICCECFITGTFLWSPHLANDVDIVCKFSQKQEILQMLENEKIQLVPGTYNESVFTAKSYVVGNRQLPINFIFLNQIDFLKWKKGTELMSLLDVPTNKTQRHAVFEMLCSISSMCQHEILKINRN